MYNSFQNGSAQQQAYYTGNFQPNMPVPTFQNPPLPLRQANTTTEFGEFVSNNQNLASFNQSGVQQQHDNAFPQPFLQQQTTGFSQPPLQQQITGFSQPPLQQQTTGFSQPPLQQQTTGFSQPPLQQQITGFSQPPLQQQTTGFSQPPLQQQTTGFSQTPLQQQTTGFSQPPVTSFGAFQDTFNQKMNQQATGNSSMPQTSFSNFQQQKLLPQNTGFYSQHGQSQAGPLKPNATGYVNAMAQGTNYNSQLIIPDMHLNFVTASDQKKFEKLFRSKVPLGSNTISGSNCREILMRSGLPPKQLAQIWNLADTLKAGELMFPEFVLAMYLINSVLEGEPLPYVLEKKIRDQVTKFVDAINFQVGETAEISNSQSQLMNSTPTPFDDLARGITLQAQPTGMMPQTSFGSTPQFAIPSLEQQGTGFIPQTSFSQQPTGFIQNQWNNNLQPQVTGTQAPQTSFGNFNTANTNALRANQTGVGLLSQPTGILPATNFQINAPLAAQKTGFGNNDLYSQSNFSAKFTAENEDYVTSEEKALFYKIFETYDTKDKGVLDSKTSVEIFRKSGLSRQDLEQIWNLADVDNTGQLNKQEFTVGMHLVYRKLNGHALPNFLPRSLIPQSTQIIDMMKDQIKSSTNQKSSELSSNTPADVSSFKNNDELPSFRNRKNSKIDVDVEIKKQREDEEQNSLELESLQKLIRDKKILITAESSKNEDRFRERQLKDLDNLKQIEIIKSSIVSLPKPASMEGSSLQSSFESLNARLVSVLSNIDTVEEAIINSKIQLFKKKNPTSIVGTGLNGEVTEQDIRKAKKKAALSERMALLTGKPILNASSIEKEESLLKEAILKIKSESSKNRETVEFIKNDINEIFSGIKSNLYGSHIKENETKKFDLGIGLETEVKEFIKHLKATRDSASLLGPNRESVPEKITSSQLTQKTNSVSQEPVSSKDFASSSSVSNPLVTADKSFSEFKTAKDRADYIKERAQERMNERLEKLGLGRRNRRERAASIQTSNKKILEPETSSQVETTSSSPEIIKDADEKENDFDDDENILRAKLDALRLKKLQKEERMRQMQKEIEEAEKEEASEYGSRAPEVFVATNEGQGSNDQAVSHSQVQKNSGSVGLTNNSSQGQQNISTQASMSPAQHHNTNPFARTEIGATSNPKAPFFQQPVNVSSSQTSFDAKAAEEQRKIQRGIASDSDGWSDEDIEIKDVAPIPAPAPAPPAPHVFTAPVPVAPKLQAFESSSVVAQRTTLHQKTQVASDDSGWSDEEDNVNTAVTPTAPPLPENPPLLSGGLSNQTIPSNHDDDDLSLPESVSSDDD